MQAQGKPLTHQIDLNLLELFDTVFRTRNLTATGVRLGLSQPAVSYGLAKLRESYGDALFVRMQRGVQPTPFAEQLAQPVAAALHIVRGTVQKTAFVPVQATRTFRIAMTDIAMAGSAGAGRHDRDFVTQPGGAVRGPGHRRRRHGGGLHPGPW
jgi:hypothetical protein